MTDKHSKDQPLVHLEAHERLRALGAADGSPETERAYRVAVRVHLEEQHGLGASLNPLLDHIRLHGATDPPEERA